MYTKVKEMTTQLITEPYSWKDFAWTVNWYRQQVINTYVELNGVLRDDKEIYFWKKRKLNKLLKELNKRRCALDDIERAYEMVFNYEMFHSDVESTYQDLIDKDYHEWEERINDLAKQDTEKDLLNEIRKTLVSIRMKLDRIDERQRYPNGRPGVYNKARQEMEDIYKGLEKKYNKQMGLKSED